MIKGYEYSADSFREALRLGIVHFSYRKSDGTEREAFGTLVQDVVDRYRNNATPQTRRRTAGGPDDDEYIRYYDLYAARTGGGAGGDWRTFRIDRLIEVDDSYDSF